MATFNRDQICWMLRDLVNVRGATEVTLVIDDKSALQLATELELALYMTKPEEKAIVAKAMTGRQV